MALDSSDRDQDERAGAEERPPDPQPTEEMTAPFDALAGSAASEDSRAADELADDERALAEANPAVEGAEPAETVDAEPVDEHGETTRIDPIGPPPPDLADPGAAFDTIAHDALPAAPLRAAGRLDLETPDYERLRAVDFPVVWRGYDPASVDAYVHEVQRAVDLFEQRTEPTAAVQRALGRVGEQTASILQQAETAAEETTRSSRAAADDRVEQARREADALHAEAVAKVRALDDDVERLWQERQRLIDATKELAEQLRKIAEDGEARFPPAAPPAAEPPPDLD